MVVRDKVTRQCPETTTSEVKARRAGADLNRGPSAYQPNSLLLGQTGSQIISLMVSVDVKHCVYLAASAVTASSPGHGVYPSA